MILAVCLAVQHLERWSAVTFVKPSASRTHPIAHVSRAYMHIYCIWLMAVSYEMCCMYFAEYHFPFGVSAGDTELVGESTKIVFSSSVRFLGESYEHIWVTSKGNHNTLFLLFPSEYRIWYAICLDLNKICLIMINNLKTTSDQVDKSRP